MAALSNNRFLTCFFFRFFLKGYIGRVVIRDSYDVNYSDIPNQRFFYAFLKIIPPYGALPVGLDLLGLEVARHVEVIAWGTAEVSHLRGDVSG